MDTILLSTVIVEDAVKRRVVVQTVDDTSDPPIPDHRQGNIDMTGGTPVKWTAASSPDVVKYTVRFYKLGKAKNEFWPFTKLKDGSTVPPGHVGPLELAPGETAELTTKLDGVEVKYAVAAEPTTGSSKITPVDPMLIIRPTRLSPVLFGLICAIAGAVAGALLALRFG